jgi:hypothetical protein
VSLNSSQFPLSPHVVCLYTIANCKLLLDAWKELCLKEDLQPWGKSTHFPEQPCREVAAKEPPKEEAAAPTPSLFQQHGGTSSKALDVCGNLSQLSSSSWNDKMTRGKKHPTFRRQALQESYGKSRPDNQIYRSMECSNIVSAMSLNPCESVRVCEF